MSSEAPALPNSDETTAIKEDPPMTPSKNDIPITPTKQKGSPAPAPAGCEFTAGEMRFMVAYFANMRAKPDVDWDQLALDLGLKDGRCAAARSRYIFARRGFYGGAGVPGTPRKDKSGEGAGEGVVADSGAKVTKTRAPRKKKVKAEAKEEMEG